MNWITYLLARAGATLPLGGEDLIPIHQTDSVKKLRYADLVPDLKTGHNLLIGGNFTLNPFQRGSASAAIANNGFLADRFRLEFDGGAVVTRDFVNVVVGSKVLGVTVRKALKLTVTNKAAATFIRFGQRIESVDTLAGDSSVLSTAIQGNKALDVPVRVVQCFGLGGAPSGNVVTAGASALAVTANLAELYADIAVPSIAGKTYGTTVGSDYLEIQYDLSNLATGDYVIIPLCKYERGNYYTPMPFENRADVLVASQRFFEKSYNIEDPPGTVTTNGMEYYISRSTNAAFNVTIKFRTRKRTNASTVVSYSPDTGVANKVRDRTGGADVAVSSYTFTGDLCTTLDTPVVNANSAISLHWTSDAEFA